ncbi:hypothetical protein LEMLEM_LOCUS1714 [Lemmus lemmus]
MQGPALRFTLYCMESAEAQCLYIFMEEMELGFRLDTKTSLLSQLGI